MARRRRQFSAEFKIEAVRLAESSRTPSAVARQLGVRADLLRKWRQQFASAANQREAFPGHGKLTSQDEEIRQLRREVAQLKEELRHPKKSDGGFNWSSQQLEHLEVVALDDQVLGGIDVDALVRARPERAEAR